jgi:7-cyano-7-deazaguanine synthase in queuosine biosynthesis
MLSGGVESSALVQHAVDMNIEAECLHVIFDNKTLREAKSARKIAEWHSLPYAEVTMNVDTFGDKYKQVKRKDSPWWGCGILTVAPLGDYDQVWYGTHREEISPVALGPSGVTLVLKSVGCNASLESPLHSYSKQEQYNSLNSVVKKLVISCNIVTVDGAPCMKCEKCIEWKNFVISA